MPLFLLVEVFSACKVENDHKYGCTFATFSQKIIIPVAYPVDAMLQDLDIEHEQEEAQDDAGEGDQSHS